MCCPEANFIADMWEYRNSLSANPFLVNNNISSLALRAPLRIFVVEEIQKTTSSQKKKLISKHHDQWGSSSISVHVWRLMCDFRAQPHRWQQYRSLLSLQVLIFMALAEGRSRVRCGPLTLHSRTALHVIESLTGVRFEIGSQEGGGQEVSCEGLGFRNTQLTTWHEQIIARSSRSLWNWLVELSASLWVTFAAFRLAKRWRRYLLCVFHPLGCWVPLICSSHGTPCFTFSLWNEIFVFEIGEFMAAIIWDAYFSHLEF